MALNEFSANVCSAAVAHARAEYPKESCGLVVAGNYVPCKNVKSNPEEEFKLDEKVWAYWRATGRVQAVIHSHPDPDPDRLCPSLADQQSQLTMPDIAWGIVFLTQTWAKGPVFWGDSLPIPPMEGRPWMMGVWDCYGLVRDYYRLKGIVLPNRPRAPQWWLDKTQEDMLLKNYDEFGFTEVDLKQIQPDDVVLIKFPAFSAPTHCGVYVGNNLALHHKWDRPSTKVILGHYMDYIEKVVRYTGQS